MSYEISKNEISKNVRFLSPLKAEISMCRILLSTNKSYEHCAVSPTVFKTMALIFRGKSCWSALVNQYVY